MNSPLSFSPSRAKFFLPRLDGGLQYPQSYVSVLFNPGQFSPIKYRKATLQISASSSSSSSTMASSDEVSRDHSPFLKIYKDGRIERIAGTEIVPASLDPTTAVESKDVVISAETGVSARLYIPKAANQTQEKLPLLVYFHGGGFCIETAFSPNYHRYVNSLVAEANVVAVSVNYRRAPEHPIPVPYDDSWAAVKWVASHFDGQGSDEWLKRHVEFQRVFFAGDSAGANIAHHMALRVGTEGLVGAKLGGIVLVHPYFWGTEPLDGESTEPERRAVVDALWRFTSPASSGGDDPYINPASDPKLGSLGSGKVLVCVAEKDMLKQRGWYYSELLRKSGWGGVVEVTEAPGEDHCFHLTNPASENAEALLKLIVSFINSEA